MAPRQIAKAQAPDPRANQALHLVPDFVEHAADLPIDSLAQNDPHQRWLYRSDPLKACALSIQHDSAQKLRRELRIPRPIE